MNAVTPLAITRPITIAVLAIGGQGGGVLVDWIVALAESQGWHAQSTSVPGVAQRTGATIYYVELIAAQPGHAPVFSPMAAPGNVDIVIAAEWMEAGRAMQRGLVTPDRTTLIASTHRAFAMSEKAVPGDGAADPEAVQSASRAAARRFIGFDMASCAEQAGSVISSVLFGALAAAKILPFPRTAFEATITQAGIGVAGSLRGFSLGYDTTRDPPTTHNPPPRSPALAPTGHAAYDALRARAAALPAAAHPMLAEALRHVVRFQDLAYAAAYLDEVERVAAYQDAALTIAAAKYIARAMTYDDVIRVAAIKTEPARMPRIQREMAGKILATTEFMHPRMAELIGLLPARLGAAFERRTRLVAWLDRTICGPRRIRTDTITGFVILYAVAGLRRWRRGNLRHDRESARMTAWLATVHDVAATDPPLATELLTNQRLIKGYSETHARGLDKFSGVMSAAARLRGRSDAAAWVRRLREAALQDEAGLALDGALRTIDSFLAEKAA